MAVSVRVTGADELVRAAAALKAAGSRELRKDMLAGIRKAAKPVIEGVKRRGDEELPADLAAQYRAAKIVSRTRTTGRSAGVRIQGPKKGKGADMGRANESGDVRHPVYGNRAAWASTNVQAGFADRGAESAVGPASAGMRAALQNTVSRIARTV